jgi:hypothetical protein
MADIAELPICCKIFNGAGFSLQETSQVTRFQDVTDITEIRHRLPAFESIVTGKCGAISRTPLQLCFLPVSFNESGE